MTSRNQNPADVPVHHGRIKTKLGLMLQQWRRVDLAEGRAIIQDNLHELEDFVGAKFYCPHVLADCSQRIRIREKTLELFSTVLSTLSPCRLS